MKMVYTTVVLTVALFGCAPDVPQQIVAKGIDRAARQGRIIAALEASAPTQAGPSSPAPFVVCVRGYDHPLGPYRLTYVAYFQRDRYVTAREAQPGDRCEAQTFKPIFN